MRRPSETPDQDATSEAAERSARPRPAQAAQGAVKGAALLYGAVALGGVIGAVLRWLASLGAAAALGAAFPWGTLAVNVTGCFAIGLYGALAGPGGRLFPGPRMRHFVMTGVCGGYTTFSVFSLETLHLVQRHAFAAAGLNVALSLVAWLGAVWLGDAAGARLNRLKGA